MWKPFSRPPGTRRPGVRRAFLLGPRPLAVGLTTLILLAGAPRAAASQEAAREAERAAEWNDDRALALADRAVRARGRTFADTALRSFRATAEGHIYFLAELGTRSRVVRADQVALEIFWQAPDRALQTIVGRRSEKRLPTRIRYHIDHLSAVLDNYGDRIRIGEGDEVRDVLHPAAPGALGHYDYRLVDSLRIRTGERTTDLYRLQVRPSDPAAPGLVGSVFVDRETGAIARLRGTFTAASYVDPQLEHVTVDLRSGLWEGRWWLPAAQQVEVRREVRWLDLPVAGVIRTEMRLGGYELNEAPPYRIGPGERVATLPAPALEAYDDWRSGLYAGRVTAEERAHGGARELVDEARELVGARALLAGPALRGHLPDVSAAVRARRAEGLLLGAGGRLRLGHRSAVSLWAGWPFARERPQARLTVTRELGAAELELRLLADRLADVGPFRGAPPLISTLGLAIEGEDWTDPYYESGAELAVALGPPGERAAAGIRVLRQRSAWLAAGPLGSGTARPVRGVDDGTVAALFVEADRGIDAALGAEWRLAVSAEAAAGGLGGLGDLGYTRLLAGVSAESVRPGSPWSWRARAAAGVASGALPAQRLWLLGGRGTLPGHPFRAWGGDRVAFADAEVARDLLHPWLRGRLLAAAGWTGLSGVGGPAAARFGVAETDRLRGALGAGLGLAYDLLRVELWRGLGGEGDWEVLLSAGTGFWDAL